MRGRFRQEMDITMDINELPPEAITLGIWIGAIGKTLVKKGVLAGGDIIAELSSAKAGLTASNTPIARGIAVEIDNMIATVKKW